MTPPESRGTTPGALAGAQVKSVVEIGVIEVAAVAGRGDRWRFAGSGRPSKGNTGRRYSGDSRREPPPLQRPAGDWEAFDMLEGVFFRDPNDFTSRTRVGTVGRELGDILRWRAPEEALAVYDVALARLAEIRGNVSARRDRALLLANFSYALRRLNRAAEARSRLVEALAIAMWIEWSRALPNSPFVLRQLALPDGEAGSRS